MPAKTNKKQPSRPTRPSRACAPVLVKPTDLSARVVHRNLKRTLDDASMDAPVAGAVAIDVDIKNPRITDKSNMDTAVAIDADIKNPKITDKSNMDNNVIDMDVACDSAAPTPTDIVGDAASADITLVCDSSACATEVVASSVKANSNSIGNTRTIGAKVGNKGKGKAPAKKAKVTASTNNDADDTPVDALCRSTSVVLRNQEAIRDAEKLLARYAGTRNQLPAFEITMRANAKTTEAILDKGLWDIREQLEATQGGIVIEIFYSSIKGLGITCSKSLAHPYLKPLMAQGIVSAFVTSYRLTVTQHGFSGRTGERLWQFASVLNRGNGNVVPSFKAEDGPIPQQFRLWLLKNESVTGVSTDNVTIVAHDFDLMPYACLVMPGQVTSMCDRFLICTEAHDKDPHLVDPDTMSLKDIYAKGKKATAAIKRR